jgi:hypothetical protein
MSSGSTSTRDALALGHVNGRGSALVHPCSLGFRWRSRRLELREHAEHVEEALSCRRAGVDGLLGGPQRGTLRPHAADMGAVPVRHPSDVADYDVGREILARGRAVGSNPGQTIKSRLTVAQSSAHYLRGGRRWMSIRSDCYRKRLAV